MYEIDFDGFLNRALDAYNARSFISDAEQARLEAAEREADTPRYSFEQVLSVIETALDGYADVDEGEAEAYADSMVYEDGLTSFSQIRLTLSACFGLNDYSIDELIAECL